MGSYCVENEGGAHQPSTSTQEPSAMDRYCVENDGSVAAGDLADGLLAGGDPRHHAAELLADRFHLVRFASRPQLGESTAAATDLADELLGECAALDLVEDPPHLGARLVGDDAGAAGEVAVLGGGGDRVPHAADALFVHEVDDELQLVQALEVR